MSKPKLEDVAHLAGVSKTTVSRVLNNRGSLSEKTKRKVFDAMEELNYYPNEVARSLFGSKTHLIGLLFPTTANPFFGELIYCLETTLSKLGYKALLCNTNNNREKEIAYLKMLLSNQVDGIIVCGNNQHIDLYKDMTAPVVSFDWNVSEKIPTIQSDNINGAKMATRYLLDKGYRQVFHVHSPQFEQSPSSLNRKCGYELAMKEAGMSTLYFELDFDLDFREKRQRLETFLASNEIEGIFATDDVTALMIRDICNHSQKDIDIVGYDGTRLIRGLYPDFVTVVQPIEDLSKVLITTLEKLIDGEELSEDEMEIILPVHLS